MNKPAKTKPDSSKSKPKPDLAAALRANLKRRKAATAAKGDTK